MSSSEGRPTAVPWALSLARGDADSIARKAHILESATASPSGYRP